MAKNKFYVVWKGLNPGIYDNWAECKAQVDGQEGAKYKSFENREEAAKAFEAGYTHYLKTASSPKAVARLAPEAPIGNPINESLAVDAACSGNPGDMEYRRLYRYRARDLPYRPAEGGHEQCRGIPRLSTRPRLATAKGKRPADLFG